MVTLVNTPDAGLTRLNAGTFSTKGEGGREGGREGGGGRLQVNTILFLTFSRYEALSVAERNGNN
jgi:hypothetical protein